MAHEMTKTDGAVFAGKPAWHGLGRVVEVAPTPYEALKLANLDWTVLESAGVSGVVEIPEKDRGGLKGDFTVRVATPDMKMLVRSDTRECLAIVGADYQIVQNVELAEMAYEIAGEKAGEVRVESAASIYGGKQVWFLLRGEAFALNSGKDEVNRYLLLSNSHNRSLEWSGTGTSVRVVCKNTLNMALNASKRAGALFSLKHTSNLEERKAMAVQAVRHFARVGRQFKEQAASLAAKPMTREQIQSFWLEVYQNLEGEVKMNPADAKEARRKEKAIEVLAGWAQRFDVELKVAGANAWNAVNAVTYWYDHDKKLRGEDDTVKASRRLESRLTGKFAEAKMDVMKLGLALV